MKPASTLAALALPLALVSACPGPDPSSLFDPSVVGAGGNAFAGTVSSSDASSSAASSTGASASDGGCSADVCNSGDGGDAGNGGPLVVTSCGSCPPSYVVFGTSSTPDNCGAVGCGGPFTVQRICLAWSGVNNFSSSCGTSRSCPPGTSLTAVPTCDCPGGFILVCVG